MVASPPAPSNASALPMRPLWSGCLLLCSLLLPLPVQAQPDAGIEPTSEEVAYTSEEELTPTCLVYSLLLFRNNGHALFREDAMDFIARWIHNGGTD